jgi:membrane dipeptidase
MRTWLVFALLLCPALAAQGPSSAALLEHARRLHKEVPLIDGHNDYPWELRTKAQRDFKNLDISKPQPSVMTDIPRLRTGGVGAQFWSVYVPVELTGQSAVTATLEEIDTVHRLVRQYPETFELALTAGDIERIFKRGRIASLIGMEGGHSIDNSIAALRMFYRLGARYMTLTHSKNTDWADSATDDPKSGGLSPFGEEIVREMNRLDMLVDLSHVSPETMEDAIRVSEAPVIFSHSSARAVTDVPRNVPDNILKLLPKNGGIVMVTFVPGFLSPKVAAWNKLQTAEQTRLTQLHPNDQAAVTRGVDEWTKANPAPRAALSDAADHIDHIRKIAGVDHIGLGGDFDGITSVPDGLEDVSKYPALTAELLRRGYTDADIRKILGLNMLRVMRASENVAKRLQNERGPSTMLFSAASQAVSQRKTLIVAMGDSTTAGTPGFQSMVEAPPSGRGDETSQYAYWLMRAHPEWEVLNQGINGQRSDEIRARFERDVILRRPRAVVIIAGVNDVYQGRRVEQVTEQLAAMYAEAAKAGIAVLAGSIIPYNSATAEQNARMRRINEWIRRQPGVTFVDTRAAVAASNDSDRLFDSPDGLHPSPSGYRRMADAIAPVLENVLRDNR